MRRYEQTHPWLTFRLDLERAPWHFWSTLGECQSKCEHIARVPLRPTTARELYQVYLAKGVHATTAIEGNTLSEEEVLQRIQNKLVVAPSRDYLAQEVDNIIKACNSILSDLQQGRDMTLTSSRLKDLNRLVLDKVPHEDWIVPGEVSQQVVGVGRYRGAPREDCDYLLTRLCEWLEGNSFKAPRTGSGIAFAVLQAILAHLYIEWIHPFGDGNGRTGRLVEFIILLRSGVPAPAAHLLSNHYNQTRQEYYRQLEAASGSGGNVIPFLCYAVQGLLDGLKQQLECIWQQQWDVAWRNYVHEHEAFRDRKDEPSRRRRRLVLDLSRSSNPVPFDRLADLSSRLAGLYAKKSGKTLKRDLDDLCRIGLIEKKPEGYIARKECILAFLPPVAAREAAGDAPST